MPRFISFVTAVLLGVGCAGVASAAILYPDADTYCQSDNSGPYGSSTTLLLKWNDASSSSWHRKSWIRYNMQGLTGGAFAGARLDLPFVLGPGNSAPDPSVFHVYGVSDNSLDNWSEAAVQWNTAPANVTSSPNLVDMTKAVDLGTFSITAPDPRGVGQTFSVSGSALETFLGNNWSGNKWATFIVCRDTQAPNNSTLNYAHAIASKEYSPYGPASLVLPAMSGGMAPTYAHEPFTYPTGDLNARDGGPGWATAWSATSANESVVAPPWPPMRYYVAGGFVDGGDTALAITGNGDPTLASRSLRQAWNTTDVYVSFLLRWAAGTVGQNDFVTLYFGSSSGPGIGVKGNRDTPTQSEPDFFVRMSSTGTAQYSTNIADNTTTFFVVGHLVKGLSGNYERYELWVNPDLGDQSIPDIVATGNAGFSSFTLLGLRSVNLDSGEMVLLDELRLGTTWQEVFQVYVPEPTSLTLVGLGVLLLGRRGLRRRRRSGP